MANDETVTAAAPAIDERPLTKQERTPLEEQGIYDKDGKLTYAGMQAVVAKGGSVIHKGVLYWRAQDLPKPEDLAEGDPNKLADVEGDLEAKLAALEARLQSVRAAKAHPVALVGDNVPPGVRVGTHGEAGHGDTAGVGAEERAAAAARAATLAGLPSGDATPAKTTTGSGRGR